MINPTCGGGGIDRAVDAGAGFISCSYRRASAKFQPDRWEGVWPPRGAAPPLHKQVEQVRAVQHKATGDAWRGGRRRGD